MRDMHKYDLHKLLKEELKNGSSDLVPMPSGQVVRNQIETDIAKKDYSFFKSPIGNEKIYAGKRLCIERKSFILLILRMSKM